MAGYEGSPLSSPQGLPAGGFASCEPAGLIGSRGLWQAVSVQMKHVVWILTPKLATPIPHLQMVTASVLDKSETENPQSAKVWNLCMFYNLQLHECCEPSIVVRLVTGQHRLPVCFGIVHPAVKCV